MSETCQIIRENRTYWTQRAPGYSRVNRDELKSGGRHTWLKFIQDRISGHFPLRRREDIRILEVGTGPGFFAIILAEAGYQVTAIDLTPAMLEQARRNAGKTAGKIRFMEMNAEYLSFSESSFDVVISRNLTWNLPHPEAAYGEWTRVLRPDGLLLNFDANWYRYLFSADAAEAYMNDRYQTARCGYQDQNVGENFDVMEDIARRVPLSSVNRPEWDINVLKKLGMSVSTDVHAWREVWSQEEKVNFASTPMFMVMAEKAV